MNRLAALALVTLWTALPLTARADCPAMTHRIIAAEEIGAEVAGQLRLLTPHLCAFLEAELGADALGPLFRVEGASDFRTRLKELTGKDVFDFGERMFAHFEASVVPPKRPAAAAVIETEHFVFVIPPGSPAAADRELILRTSAQMWRTMAEVLDVGEQLEGNARLLLATVPAAGVGEATRYPGKIAVHLHSYRSEEAKEIPRHSYGVASFGATITAADATGPPQLVSRIDVLYFNPFSLMVLHHEIAHSVMLLASFDGSRFDGRTLKGKRELRRAFLSGYRKIPAFLHEAIGDYSFYYRGFHQVWPLLVGSPEELVLALRQAGGYIPLTRLLQEGGRFRAAHHKSFSLQAAAFIHYLSETRGSGPLREWLLANDDQGARSFQRVFGASIESVEAEWLAWLAGAAHPPDSGS
jgi:hypothetical protein